MFSVDEIRKDFPIFQRQGQRCPLIYLDNASTTQKPKSVIDAIEKYYRECNANVHRGAYGLSEQSTHAFEAVREQVKRFIHAASSKEIVFVRGATEAINLVAHSFGRAFIKAGDEIIISAMEHHANIVPWQLLCEQTGAILKVIAMNAEGEIDLAHYATLFNARTKLVSVVHVSNTLGTINPIQKIVAIAHAHEVPVLVDGAQAVGHMPVDVQALGCDFYVFSGHKLLGPTGVGVLYGRSSLLEKMPPYQGGGGMIQQVSFTKTIYQAPPYKFEAGTPPIAEVIGLGAAMTYIENIGRRAIAAYERDLLNDATTMLSSIKGVRIIGTAHDKSSIISFVMMDAHPHDISTILDQQGIAIRAGHHCTMPLMEYFKVPATARISFAFYNHKVEIEKLGESLEKVKEVFA